MQKHYSLSLSQHFESLDNHEYRHRDWMDGFSITEDVVEELDSNETE